MRKQRPSREFREFIKLTDRLITVPKDEILRREANYKAEVAQNPKKRGPKPKT